MVVYGSPARKVSELWCLARRMGAATQSLGTAYSRVSSPLGGTQEGWESSLTANCTSTEMQTDNAAGSKDEEREKTRDESHILSERQVVDGSSRYSIWHRDVVV